MKKILTLIMATILSSATMAQDLAKTPDGDNPLTFSVENNIITVKLVGNATTGYTWGHKVTQEGVVELLNDEYAVPQNEDGHIVMGQPGVHTFVFELKKYGKTTIIFDYGQHWKNGNTAGVRKINIKYSENKTVIKENKKKRNL